MTVYSEAVSFVVHPMTVIYIAIGMNESSLAVRLVVNPVALIRRAVRPHLYALTLPYRSICEPLSFIADFFLKNYHFTRFSLTKCPLKLVVVVLKPTKLFAHHLKT